MRDNRAKMARFPSFLAHIWRDWSGIALFGNPAPVYRHIILNIPFCKNQIYTVSVFLIKSTLSTMKKKTGILLLIACFTIIPLLSSCGPYHSYHSYWGVEGEYGDHHHHKHKKPKPPKKHKYHKPKHHKHKHHHHDDDDD